MQYKQQNQKLFHLTKLYKQQTKRFPTKISRIFRQLVGLWMSSSSQTDTSWSLRVNPSVQLNQSPRKRVFVESWAKKEENIVRCNTVYTRVKWLVVKDQLVQIQNAPLLQRQCYASGSESRKFASVDRRKAYSGYFVEVINSWEFPRVLWDPPRNGNK